MVLKIKRKIVLCLLAFFFVGLVTTTLRSVDAQTVIACGGFVKGPESIDFSRIEVRLFTVDGILKYQSFCAPHNGYFTVPVYNNGDYILKLLPPTGWTFNPPQVALKIDGKTDPCSKQEDINFAFAGFQVSGKVFSAGSEFGPEGLRLELQGETPADVKITQTSSNGGFSFDGVLPGKYKLTAVHLSWRFKQNSIPIEVTKENIVAPIIQVTGYDLTGSVISDTGPISGVQVTLFAPEKNAVTVAECKSDFAKIPSVTGYKPVCAVLSDPSGIFSFPPLPPGNYRLVPYFQNARTRFSVVPSSHDLTISNSSVIVKEPFVVSGFSVSGRLVFPSGYPAKDVVVLINDKPVAKTGDDGIYTIEEMKSGAIKLTFTAVHAEFPPLSASVTPENAVLNDVSASKIAACGQVVGESGPDTVEMAAKNSKSNAVTKVTVQTKKSRQFCFMLESGDYVISVENPPSMFRPRQVNVALKAGPHFGVSFEAFVASASGRVLCLEKDCTGVFLTLFQRNEQNGQPLTATAELKTSKTGEFNFRNLHPGQYLLKAVRSPFCFSHPDGLPFTIDDKDVADLQIKHTGYSLTLNSAHPIRLGFKHADKPDVSTAAEVQPPSQPSAIVCLPQPGRYKVTHEKFSGRDNDWGCHFFSGSFPAEVDTNNLPREINPVALLHLVTIGVLTTIQVPLDELYVGIRYIENSTFHNKIFGKPEEDPITLIGIEEEIAAYNKQKALRQPITTPLKRRDRLYFGEDQVTKNSNATYSHNSAIFWYATQIALEPKHPRLIFKPKMVEFTLDQDSVQCPAFAAFFIGVEAYVLRGYVTPQTAGVRVTLTNRRNSEEVHVVWTEQDGSYSLGPLDPGDVFDAEASIEGWEIQRVQNQPGNFTAKRLGSIEVSVVDDNGNPLEGALISISGPGHFRNNSLTGKEGIVYLGSLSGGQYYAQAFRKEYAFEPKNVLIPLKSGEASTIKFIGKRVAYSCFGQVVSLNGEPEQGLFVVARSIDCENAPGEEAETDAAGNFRVMGLFPQCTYSITLRPIPQLERTVPTSAVIYVKNSDVAGVKIWAVRSPPQQLLITTRLEGPAEFLNLLQVSLLNLTSGATVNSITPTSLLLAFPPIPPPPAASSYAIKLEPLANFASSVYLLQTEPVPLQLDESGFVHVVIKFEVKRRSDAQSDLPIASLVQTRSLVSLLIAIVVVAVIGGIYYYASADKNTKQAALENARSLLSNPTGFVKSRLSKQRPSSPIAGRSEKVAPARQTTAKSQQQSQQQQQEKSSSDEFTSEIIRRSSSSEGSSTESSTPDPANESPTSAADQPRKRVQARTRLQ